MRRIGLYVERQRAWGRRLCEGVAAFAQKRRDWSLVMLEREDLSNHAHLACFDGFIARVPDKRTAAAFRLSGRPVADLSIEPGLSDGFLRGVEQDNLAVGRLAAQHFADRRFVNFAFCGFDGRRFSDERRAAFVDTLRSSGFACHCYATPRTAVQAFDRSITGGERLVPSVDTARLTDWLKHLPKPVAIFCANDLRGYQVMQACHAAALAVPESVALLGVDNDTLICNFMTPTLSSIDPDAFALGHAAADMLQRALDAPDANVQPLRVSPRELVVRASSETFPVDPPWLAEALVFIGTHLDRHLTAADVYRHVGLSHTRINAVFRKVLGTTVQQAIRNTALTEASRLLETTDLPIAEISARCGFATPQYFCNVFTQAVGHAPSFQR